MDKFEWEERYLVLKKKDIDCLDDKGQEAFWAHVDKALDMLPALEDPREYLVIEGDWPEYQPARNSIEARMTGKAHGVPDVNAELLAALEELVELADGAMLEANRDGACYNRKEELSAARAAIAKAKGGAA